MNWKFCLLFILFWGCARVQTLNMDKHQYSERPQSVIWIQVPGLNIEQLALLKLSNKDVFDKTNFEKSSCVGHMWNFNLYDLKVESKKALFSQLNGSPNIKGTCDDFNQKPVWKYFQEMGYQAAIFEQVTSVEESVLRSISCSSNQSYIGENDLILMMSPQNFTNSPEFHRFEKNWPLKGIAYDKACLSGECASTLEANIQDFYSQWAKLDGKNFLLIRNTVLEKALLKKDLVRIKEALSELNRLINYFLQKNGNRGLLLITSSNSMAIELPEDKKAMLDFEKTGKNFIVRNSNVFSNVLSYGAMAENFCGIYKEYEILKRILYRPPRKQFDYDYLIPF